MQCQISLERLILIKISLLLAKLERDFNPMGGKSHSKSSEKSGLYGKVVFLFVLFLFFP